jgi:dienelactone hydrolase
VQAITYISRADHTRQPCLFYTPVQASPVPLLVALHTWSGDYRQAQPFYAQWCIKNRWAMIHPHCRGPNRSPQACGSDLAVQDILDAVAYAREQVKIDTNRIYLVGVSGGGYMAMLMAGRAPELWAGVSAWCGIHDLAAWHAQQRQSHGVYDRALEAVCRGAPGASAVVDHEYSHRSPATWLKRATDVPLDLAAGIADGHSGSVPVSHTLHAFNDLAAEADHIPEAEIAALTSQPSVPQALQYSAVDPLYGSRRVLYRRQSRQVRVTLFEGGHEIVPNVALAWLAAQRRGQSTDWNPGTGTKGAVAFPEEHGGAIESGK